MEQPWRTFEGETSPVTTGSDVGGAPSAEALLVPIVALRLSPHLTKALHREGIIDTGNLCSESRGSLRQLSGVDVEQLDEIEGRLRVAGLSLADVSPPRRDSGELVAASLPSLIELASLSALHELRFDDSVAADALVNNGRNWDHLLSLRWRDIEQWPAIGPKKVRRIARQLDRLAREVLASHLPKGARLDHLIERSTDEPSGAQASPTTSSAATTHSLRRFLAASAIAVGTDKVEELVVEGARGVATGSSQEMSVSDVLGTSPAEFLRIGERIAIAMSSLDSQAQDTLRLVHLPANPERVTVDEWAYRHGVARDSVRREASSALRALENELGSLEVALIRTSSRRLSERRRYFAAVDSALGPLEGYDNAEVRGLFAAVAGVQVGDTWVTDAPVPELVVVAIEVVCVI